MNATSGHPPAAPAAVHTVQQNRHRYRDLVSLTRHYLDTGDVERLLRVAMLAAGYAWRAPVGLLADPELEEMVIAAVGGGADTDSSRDPQGRVLHVLTEAMPVGGHTRLAWRWIEHDPRPCDIALTMQTGPVPDQLLTAVAGAGGEVRTWALDGDLLQRAHELRALMDRADRVVLHVHPHDTIALAAANLPGPRPPIIYENHADHVFWLGARTVDVVSHFRPVGARLSRDLRGVPADRSAVVPLPLDLPAPSDDPGDMRQRLGLPADAVVAVTVATADKLAPLWGTGMQDLLDRALDAIPDLAVALVGVSPQDGWSGLAERHAGRVALAGVVPDPDPYYAMADIYLESYPTRAGTSVLEAALRGRPLLALADLDADDRLTALQDPAASVDTLSTARTLQEYLSRLEQLVAEPAHRAGLGARAREVVVAEHTGEGWLRALDALYDQAGRARLAPATPVTEDVRYAAFVAALAAPTSASPPPGAFLPPLGQVADARLHADVFALTHAAARRPVRLRVDRGWERQPEWTARLLDLAARFDHLAVSLPPAEDETAADGPVRDAAGRVTVDATRPDVDGVWLPGEVPVTDAALDSIELLLASPGWQVAAGGSDR